MSHCRSCDLYLIEGQELKAQRDALKPARKPLTLTDEQIMDLGREMFKAPRWPSTAIDFARAVLAAAQENK